MYHGTVMPSYGEATDAKHRDVGPDRWGFKYRQHPNGLIVVLKAPLVGNFGYWIPGTEGGPLQGKTLKPGDPVWAKVTKQIGEHPHQISMRKEIAELKASRPSYGKAPWVQAFQNVASGFTAEPTGDEGDVTATLVEAVPGVKAAVSNLVTPSTLEGLHRRLGKLKGKLRATRDPSKRAVLKEQIKAIEYKIQQLQAVMAAPVSGVDIQQRPSWVPFAIGGTILALIGVGAVAAARKR